MVGRGGGCSTTIHVYAPTRIRIHIHVRIHIRVHAVMFGAGKGLLLLERRRHVGLSEYMKFTIPNEHACENRLSS